MVKNTSRPIVLKFGGSSVGTIERIDNVASIIKSVVDSGQRVIVVVSAMQGETDRLIQLTTSFGESAKSAREYDRIVSLGECLSSALVALALQQKGLHAVSLNGADIPVITDDKHKNATILEVKTKKLKTLLLKHKIPVITGFQGVTKEGEITTLGRGGSDTTAVAIAAAMKASECCIYTDVEGVYTSDPNVVSKARLLDHITYDTMLALSRLGAKVLHRQSVLIAKKNNVPVRVLSTFKAGSGTLVGRTHSNKPCVSGVAFEREQTKFSIVGIPNDTHFLSTIRHHLTSIDFDIDMTVENYAASENHVDYSFTVHVNDADKAQQFADHIAQLVSAKQVVFCDNIAKLSLVGLGMKSHAGLSSKIFETLSAQNIPIYLIASSEAKISAVIDRHHTEHAARLLHDAFDLSNANYAYDTTG